MYLDFVIDIAEVGNLVVIETNTETIKGSIVKLSKDFIAIKKVDGSIIVKKDCDISNIEIQPTKITEGKDIKQSKSTNIVRCGMTLIKNDMVESFTCNICGKPKTSKKYAVEINNPDSRICNSCYGWTLNRLKNK